MKDKDMVLTCCMNPTESTSQTHNLTMQELCANIYNQVAEVFGVHAGDNLLGDVEIYKK